MKGPELAVTLLYLLACVGIALRFRRRAGAGSEAFWAAERGIGVWVNGFGTFSTLVSAASFLGFLGLTVKWGWSFTAIALGASPTLAFILSLLLFCGPLRRYSETRGKFTVSNFIAERYGPGVGLVASVLIILIFSAYIVPQLIGGGLTAEYVLGVRPKLAVVLVGGVFVFYVLLGGMLSVTWTDFIQGILMFALMVGLATTAFSHFGGVGPLVSRAVSVKPHFLDLDPAVSRWTYLGFATAILLFVLSAPHTVLRLFTVKDVRKGRASLAVTAALCLVFHLVGYLGVAAAAIATEPNLSKVDDTFVVVMNRFFPAAVRGLAVSAILAAIMSTAAGLLLTVGAEFSQNLYKRYVRPRATEAETIRAARGAMLGVGALAIVVALFETRGIGDIVGQLVAAMGSAFAAPLVAGLWWKRANAAGGLLGIAGGFVAYLVAHYGLALPPFCEILVSFPASVAGLVAGSLAAAPPRAEVVEFVAALHRDLEAGIENRESRRTAGVFPDPGP